MSKRLYSSLWYRVADLRPALGTHTEIHRHLYRGEIWYVLRDLASSRVHRCTSAAHHLVGLMDGERTVQELWDLTETALGDAAPTQDETIELLAQLHSGDLLQVDTSPDTDELFRRYRAREQQQWQRRLMSPLSLRFHLLDPDRFLTRWMAPVRPLFGVAGLLSWLGVVGIAAVLACMHWPELTENVADRILTPGNLLLIWLSYPVIKLLHELGHAFAVKRWGGDVHDMGVMLLVLVPVPYVDASAASAFPNKHRRMVVGAAGILVEVFLAALALFVWLAVEPGVIRSVAFNVMLIGGVSTVFFNGNPLLRYDGYYVLADALGIPNLAPRAQRCSGNFCQRYLFGLADTAPLAGTTGERCWLIAYALASLTYRLMISVAIILFIAGKFFVVGILLAIWAAISQFLLPAARALRFLLVSPRLQGSRARALTVSGTVVVTLAALLFLAPFPLWTRAEGVVWAPPKAEVRAGADGILVRVLAEPNSRVRAGDALLQLEDPTLKVRVSTGEADLQEITARYNAARMTRQIEADNLREQMATLAADVARSRERLAELTVRSGATGVFVVDRPGDLVGRYIHQGDLVGLVVDLSRGTVRVAVTQADIGLIRGRTRSVAVRLAERLDQPLAAKVRRAVPSAGERLPSAVLGTTGGGRFAIDPADKTGTRTLDKVFDIELELAEPVKRLGGRAYVRFEHGAEPLGLQWYRRLRQLLLGRFDV